MDNWDLNPQAPHKNAAMGPFLRVENADIVSSVDISGAMARNQQLHANYLLGGLLVGFGAPGMPIRTTIFPTRWSKGTWLQTMRQTDKLGFHKASILFCMVRAQEEAWGSLSSRSDLAQGPRGDVERE